MATIENQPTNLIDDAIQFTVHHKPHCVVEFSVTASKKAVDEAHQSAVKSVSKSVTVPGFRKGKAPESLISSSFSREIEQATKENLVRRSYIECQSLSSLPNLDSKGSFSYQFQTLATESATLSLSFETNPVVPTVDLTNCQLTSVKRPEVNQAKVDETIRQALFFRASWKTVSGRPVQEGDFVILDAEVLESTGSTSPLFKGTRFEVTDPSMAKWMKDAILGKNVGDTAEGTSVADEDASEEEKVLFKPSKVKLTVQTIEEVCLPELTEELLKQLGADSLEDLKAKIETQLNEQADDHVQEALRDQAIDYLIKNYSFDLPRSFVRKELEFRTSQLSQDKAFMDHWHSLSEEEKQKVIGFLTSQTEKSIILSLLCSALLKQNNIPFPKHALGDNSSFGEYSQQVLIQATDYLIKQSQDKAIPS